MRTIVSNPKSADVRSRIDPDLKMQSSTVRASPGLDLSEAIRPFLHEVVEVRGLPFRPWEPNATTVSAMPGSRAQRGSARFGSTQELFDAPERQQDGLPM